MTTYAFPDFKTKKALKEAIKKGIPVVCRELSPFGAHHVEEGTVYLSGPHYPKPHKWYAVGKVVDGVLTSIK